MFGKILETPTAQLGKAGRFAVFQIKLWSHCARLLRTNRSGQQAAALSYHTMFGLVPLAIVMLLIFQLFPAYSDIGQKVKNFIYAQAHLTAFKSQAASAEGPEKTVTLTEHLDQLIESFFAGTHKGTITIVSILIVIWAAIALVSTIEKAFNNIWHIGKGRGLLQRVINYWALLTLGPLVLGVGIYLSSQYSAIVYLQKTVLSFIAPAILSYVIAAIVFFLLYFVLPHTKVNAKAAIWGAAAASLVWIVAKGLFGYAVTEMKLYSTVYGVLALVPMTVLWIYVTWLIVLFGLQLTFTTQHLKTLDAAEVAAAKKREDFFIANDLTAINMVREIATGFESNNAPVEAQVISSRLNIPAELNEKVLNHLVAAGIIVKTSQPKEGFMPAREPDKIKLSEISEAVSAVSFAQSPIGQPNELQRITQSQRDALAEYNIKALLGTG